MFGKLFGRKQDVTDSGLPAANVTVSPVTAVSPVTTTTTQTEVTVQPGTSASLDLGALVNTAREARAHHPNDPMAMAAEIQQKLGMQPMVVSPTAFQPPAAAQPDVVSQLERLAKLHEEGALTDEEFSAEKAKLIGPGA
jgi:hypothetical protein